MIVVTYSGTAFGGKAGTTSGCVGVFMRAEDAVVGAIRHRGKWISSHNGIGVRPIREWTHYTGDGDPRKIEVSASGGWGDSLYINYEFETVNPGGSEPDRSDTV